jgi:Protein of Unknown function (DUF2604)
MSEEEHRRSDDNEAELETELLRVRTEEEKLQRELENVRGLEKRLESELEHDHHHPITMKFVLVFIINGEDFRIETSADAFLSEAVEKALVESGNTGRRNPLEWEVRDTAGVLLEMARKIKGLGLANDARLFLSLKVGAGGNHADRS